MMSFKQFSVSVLAVAAAVAASSASAAVNQPVTATTATINFDTSFLATNGITVSALGSATVNSTTGVGTLPVSAVTLASTATGPITVSFGSTSGVALKTSSGATVNLTNFTYDASTHDLSANVSYGIFLNLTSQSLLTANNTAGDFGGAALTSVTNSTATRTLKLWASDFTLSSSFQSLLSSNGLNPSSFAFVAGAVKSIAVGVPEPSTYALMGLGLVGMGLVARRKQQA